LGGYNDVVKGKQIGIGSAEEANLWGARRLRAQGVGELLYRRFWPPKERYSPWKDWIPAFAGI